MKVITKTTTFAILVFLSAVNVQAKGGWFDHSHIPDPPSCEKSQQCQFDYEICYQRTDGKFCLIRLEEGDPCLKERHPQSVCAEGLECRFNHFWDWFDLTSRRFCQPIRK